jgi:hypothetical protein
MRERVDLKSPVRENRPPGSVRGAPGNRRPYRDCGIKACQYLFATSCLGQTRPDRGICRRTIHKTLLTWVCPLLVSPLLIVRFE